ncbi:hypothetical protein [Thermoanaerobacterium sp. RBIITD]|nr:hypothetical protein [Thermoanaerobacterium sp. RBIITD]SNX52952.1 hypothetical protein SAMN05660242_0421 [Thermoanaerobacterium sp. RBIITD]
MQRLEKDRNKDIVKGIIIETLYVVVMMLLAYVIGFVMVKL